MRKGSATGSRTALRTILTPPPSIEYVQCGSTGSTTVRYGGGTGRTSANSREHWSRPVLCMGRSNRTVLRTGLYPPYRTVRSTVGTTVLSVRIRSLHHTLNLFNWVPLCCCSCMHCEVFDLCLARKKVLIRFKGVSYSFHLKMTRPTRFSIPFRSTPACSSFSNLASFRP